MHPDGQRRAERFHLSNDGRYKKNWWISPQYIWKKWNDERSFRLQRSVDQVAPSSPRVWRRATRTSSLLAIPEMASVVFLIQHILVAVERFLVELMTIHKKSSTSELVKEQHRERGDPLCRFFKKSFRSETLQDFLLFVAIRSFNS